MTDADHLITASYGKSPGTDPVLAKQKALIDSGDFRGALQLDLDDIKRIQQLRGDTRYDASVKAMLDYVDQLEKAGVIKPSKTTNVW